MRKSKNKHGEPPPTTKVGQDRSRHGPRCGVRWPCSMAFKRQISSLESLRETIGDLGSKRRALLRRLDLSVTALNDVATRCTTMSERVGRWSKIISSSSYVSRILWNSSWTLAIPSESLALSNLCSPSGAPASLNRSYPSVCRIPVVGVWAGARSSNKAALSVADVSLLGI